MSASLTYYFCRELLRRDQPDQIWTYLEGMEPQDVRMAAVAILHGHYEGRVRELPSPQPVTAWAAALVGGTEESLGDRFPLGELNEEEKKILYMAALEGGKLPPRDIVSHPPVGIVYHALCDAPIDSVRLLLESGVEESDPFDRAIVTLGTSRPPAWERLEEITCLWEVLGKRIRNLSAACAMLYICHRKGVLDRYYGRWCQMSNAEPVDWDEIGAEEVSSLLPIPLEEALPTFFAHCVEVEEARFCLSSVEDGSLVTELVRKRMLDSLYPEDDPVYQYLREEYPNVEIPKLEKNHTLPQMTHALHCLCARGTVEDVQKMIQHYPHLPLTACLDAAAGGDNLPVLEYFFSEESPLSVPNSAWDLWCRRPECLKD